LMSQPLARLCQTPTNDGGKRALRHAAIWRRISGGTDRLTGKPIRGRFGAMPHSASRTAGSEPAPCSSCSVPS
jgi:hypothetical protein